MATTHLYTIEDVERLEDDRSWELIRGELTWVSPTHEPHGWTVANITGLIWQHVRVNQLGRTYSGEQGFVLERSPDTLLAPDVAFVSAERVQLGMGGFLELAPDLVVEVRSTSEPNRRVAEKIRAYIDAGVRLIWIVDPRRRTIRVVTADEPERLLRESDDLDGGDVLPGFRVAVSEVFRS